MTKSILKTSRKDVKPWSTNGIFSISKTIVFETMLFYGAFG